MAVPGVAHAEERVCRGTLGAVTVDNLRVPDRATCTLNGTRVKGTVKVESGATLRANNINVVGNVQAEDHRLVIVRTSHVGGSIQLVQGGATGIQSAALTGNRVSGDVQLFENLGPQVVSNNRIDGNLQCKPTSRPRRAPATSSTATARTSAASCDRPGPLGTPTLRGCPNASRDLG